MNETVDQINNHVGKVSTRFEYFASRFASLSELSLIQIKLGAEFDSESNGDIFRPGFRSKDGTSPQNTDFFRFLRKVFGVRIRYFSWVEPKIGWVEFSIKFCIEWYYFRLGSSTKNFLFPTLILTCLMPLISLSPSIFARWPWSKIVSFDAEFNADFNSTTFRLNSAEIANPDAKYFSQKSEKISILGVKYHLLIGNLVWKCPHSIQNRIVHLTQSEWESTQIKRRIRTQNTRIWC